MLHENVHDNIQLKCVFCPYTTVLYESLTYHQRAHFNVREYKCEICGKDFMKKNNLAVHFDQKHSGMTTKCPLCDFVAPRPSIQTHLRTKHEITGSHWDASSRTFILPN